MLRHSQPGDDPASGRQYEDMERHLEAAWQAALRHFRCVECARLDLAQRLRLMARAKGWEITGEQPEDETVPVPQIGSDGVHLVCGTCRADSDSGFFKPGTDDLR